MILKIFEYPDKLLRQVSESVDLTNGISSDITELVSNMAETMYYNAGIGLSAIQVGVPLRVIVYDVTQDRGKVSDLTALINPELFYMDGTPFVSSAGMKVPLEIKKGIKTMPSQEGCLSIPFVFEVLQRAEECIVEFINMNGNKSRLHLVGTEAICVQHEMDHLNGILFTDRLSRLKLASIEKNKGKSMISAGRRMISAIEKNKKQINLM